MKICGRACTECGAPLTDGRRTYCSDECAKIGKAKYHQARRGLRLRAVHQQAIDPCPLQVAWARAVVVEQEQQP